MNVDNSKWFVRVAPDETYWEPCAQKAGFHLSFARINQGCKAWQAKLVPVQQEMEDSIAKLAGAPYKARKVTFHLPDFIDIVVNAGDDRDALGATIGQSLPNWGPVGTRAAGARSRWSTSTPIPTAASARKAQAESMLDAASAKLLPGSTEPGLLSTILHEATHNLGPAHEYKVGGKDDRDVFGGPVASMMEELKAQTGALLPARVPAREEAHHRRDGAAVHSSTRSSGHWATSRRACTPATRRARRMATSPRSRSAT